jgi:hypothetical protein
LTPPVQPQNEQLASEQVNEVKEVNNKWEV